MDFLLITEKPWFFPVIGTDRRPFQSRPKVPVRKLSPSRSQKKSDTCSLFFGICIANAIECALMRGYSKIDIVLIVKEKANRKVRLFVCR